MKLECEKPLIVYQIGYHISDKGRKVKTIVFTESAASMHCETEEDF